MPITLMRLTFCRIFTIACIQIADYLMDCVSLKLKPEGQPTFGTAELYASWAEHGASYRLRADGDYKFWPRVGPPRISSQVLLVLKGPAPAHAFMIFLQRAMMQLDHTLEVSYSHA